MRKGSLQQTPLVRGILPKAEKKCIQVIEPEAFDRLLVACRPAGESTAILDRVAARNRSILWILMDTGMRVSDLCGLRASDVNREQRSLRVQGRGEERWLTLSPNGWFQVLSSLESHRLTEGCSQEKQAQEAPLFLSETYQPLTINALTLLFDRLRKRAKMTEERINPSRLRDTFAVRYLQAGGDREVLRALLGLTGMESVKRYEHLSTQQIAYEPQKERTEEHAASEGVLFSGNQESDRLQQFILNSCTNGITNRAVHSQLFLFVASRLRWIRKGPVHLRFGPWKDGTRFRSTITDRNDVRERLMQIAIQRFRLLPRNIDAQFCHRLDCQWTDMRRLRASAVCLEVLATERPQQSFGHL